MLTSTQLSPQICRPPAQVVGASGWPPSQLPPGQDDGITWQGTPVWQRLSSVRPQPRTAATAMSKARFLVMRMVYSR